MDASNEMSAWEMTAAIRHKPIWFFIAQRNGQRTLICLDCREASNEIHRRRHGAGLGRYKAQPAPAPLTAPAQARSCLCRFEAFGLKKVITISTETRQMTSPQIFNKTVDDVTKFSGRNNSESPQRRVGDDLAHRDE
ncbi:hypothetical protein F4820DRAFT_452686 [Hypoxylon rubiginosum]|uniref:Uncharacterized protein n=1 Tax=Hypoxylon rubiginosum TaxID=110542 RepID=A0ACB9YML9_9PEZI|nr:hypothetical protein F4820DRAFT_452686 [Hypoxylon rubiginosum]